MERGEGPGFKQADQHGSDVDVRQASDIVSGIETSQCLDPDARGSSRS